VSLEILTLQRVWSLALLIAACLLVPSCPRDEFQGAGTRQSQPAAESEPETYVEVPARVQEQVNIVDGEPGNITSYGKDTRPPEGWPDYLPLYEGATIISSQRQKASGMLTLMLGFDSSDPPRAIVEFYLAQIKGRGFTLVDRQDTGKQLIYKYERNGSVLQIQSAEEKLLTKTFLAIASPIDE
jgi:hypothetical protein